MEPNGLTERSKQFCINYLGEHRFNGTAAYRAAYGCSSDSARTGSARLLADANVQAYLAHMRAKITRHTEVTLERTIEEIGRVAFSDITDLITFNSEGVTLKDSSKLDKDVTAAIATVKASEITRTFGDESETRVESQVKMHNKLGALNLLSQFFGITTDFNQARASLRRYGLELTQDPESELGWRLEAYGAADRADTSAEADEAADEFFEEEAEAEDL